MNGLNQNTQILEKQLKRKNPHNHVLVSMVSNLTTYQLLQMMTDDDFNYLVDFNPELIDDMCIKLTVELLTKSTNKPN